MRLRRSDTDRLRALALVALPLLAFGACSSIRSTSWGLGAVEAQDGWQDPKFSPSGEALEIECGEANGSGEALLTGLRGFKERKKYDDNFIAELDVVCADYTAIDDQFLPAGATTTTRISNRDDFRTEGSETIDIPSDGYPIGLVVMHNRDGEYLKNLHLISAPMNLDGVLDDVDWWSPNNNQVTEATVPDYSRFEDLDIRNDADADESARHTTLLCAQQHVLTGVSIEQNDTRNSKIRLLEILCRELVEK